MFIDGKNYNKELLLNDANITESAIKLLNKSFENEINSEDFNKQFFELSKEINFFHQFSRIYAKMFINDNEWHEIFVSLFISDKI